jgi:hypothetical protein
VNDGMKAVLDKFQASADAEPPLCERCGTPREYREQEFTQGMPGYGLPSLKMWVYMCRCPSGSIQDKWYPERKEPQVVFDSVHPQLKDQRQIVLSSIKYNAWMILSGDVGTGKTFLARCAVNDFLDRGKPAELITWSEVLRQIRHTYDDATAGTEQSVIKKLGALELLVIDDYGAQRSNTDFALAKLQDIIDERYSGDRMTIITTNFDQQQFADSMDPRTTDRIAAKGSFVVFSGVNLRQAVATQRRQAEGVLSS